MSTLPGAVRERVASCGLFGLGRKPGTDQIKAVVVAVSEEFSNDGAKTRSTVAKWIERYLVDFLEVNDLAARIRCKPLIPDEGPATPLPIYTDVEVHNLPDPEWLVDDLFLSESQVALFGSTGHGKTFVGLDLAFSIATGRPFHGKDVEPGNVVYVYAEGAPSLKYRVDAWKTAHGWPLEEETNVWFIPTAVDLGGENSDGVSQLLETINAVVPHPVKLVVIDTLARSFGDEDEDSTQAMNRFTNRCGEIREALGSAVLVIHHTGWKEDRERGNKSLRNNFDTMMKCSKPGKTRVRLECKKQKDAPPFDPVVLRLDEVELPGGETSCVLRSLDSRDATGLVLSENEVQALCIVGDSGENGITFEEWKKEFMDRTEMSDSTFKRIRTDVLVPGGYVTSPPDKESTRGFRYQLTAKGRAALPEDGVQEGMNPNPKSNGASAPSGSESGPREVVDEEGLTVGSNWSSVGTMTPSA